jgi:hypothetical protein
VAEVNSLAEKASTAKPLPCGLATREKPEYGMLAASTS